ncbi:MAG: hypothetical protein RML12_03950 [Xanthomonadales bacterium]|nr:hypothetical protein [Xanthomonadales bacterium]
MKSGMLLAMVALLLPSTASACVFGQERWAVGCEVNCVASRDGSTCPRSCVAEPGEGEVILGHRVEVLGQSNGSHHVSRVAGDFVERYRERIERAYAGVRALLPRPAPAELDAGLEMERQRSLERLAAAEARDRLRLTVDASLGGTIYAPRRGFSRARLHLRLLCVAPDDLGEQIAKRHLGRGGSG